MELSRTAARAVAGPFHVSICLLAILSIFTCASCEETFFGNLQFSTNVSYDQIMEVIQVPVLSDNVAYLLIDKKTKVAAAVVRQNFIKQINFSIFFYLFLR